MNDYPGTDLRSEQHQSMMAWRQMQQRVLLASGYGPAVASRVYEPSIYQMLYNNLLEMTGNGFNPMLARNPASTPLMSPGVITPTSASVLSAPGSGAMLMAAAAAAGGGHSPGPDGARSPLTPPTSSTSLLSHPQIFRPGHPRADRYYPYMRPPTSSTDHKRVDAS